MKHNNHTEMKIKKEEAERMAHDFLRNRIGNIPHVTQAVLENHSWVVPVEVNYPKVFLDKIKNLPLKTRFIRIPNAEKIIISAIDGKFEHTPTVWSIEAQINKGLESIKNSVEKALVKVGAHNFSLLPFSEHRYTPILDILATLLTEERFSLEDVTKDEFQAHKYKKYIEDLEKLGLVRVNENIIIPGDLFTVMEERLEDHKNIKISDMLSALLTLFFERGYEYIDSVRGVLGSHLALGGFIYQESFEYGEAISFTKNDIRIAIDNEYKNVKIPRYLLQLERIGIIEEDKSFGITSWKPKEDIFDKFSMEKEILEPIAQVTSL